jgi:hypothetical protein
MGAILVRSSGARLRAHLGRAGVILEGKGRGDEGAKLLAELINKG